MRILCLIPARGGSKRLTGKNIRTLGGKPLIVWSIDAVKGVPDVCDIVVTTDCPEIANVATEAGAMVPWLRPAELATDNASSVDVCLHALDWYELEHGAVDALLLLQPTSPFRGRKNIMRGISLFQDNHFRAVVGISPAESHPLWCFKVQGLSMSPFVEEHGLQKRSQDLMQAYVVNGAFYLLQPDELRRTGSFYGNAPVPLIMESQEECLDIDIEWDWKIAEAILQLKAMK